MIRIIIDLIGSKMIMPPRINRDELKKVAISPHS
jgi:hypothetical protein